MTPHPSEWTGLAWAIVSVICVIVLFCLGWLGKHAVAAAQWCWVNSRAAVALFERIEAFMKDIAERLGLVEKQLDVNGGKNLRGTLDRIEKEIAFEQHVRRRTEHRAVVESRVDANGVSRVVYVSQEWSRITGQYLSDLQDGKWHKVIADEDKERILEAAERARDLKQGFSERYTIVREDERGRMIRTIVNHEAWPHKTDAGVLVGWAAELTPVYKVTEQAIA